MKFTNIKPGEKIRVARTIKINNANGNPRFKKEWEEIDAYEFAKGLIKRESRPGWELEV